MQKRKKVIGRYEPPASIKDLPVYCVCRSTDGERFMIACDRCEEWYHGDCISVTPKQAEQIKTFYCPQCRRKEPSLQIVYKNSRSHRPKCGRNQYSPAAVTTYLEPSSPKSSTSRRNNPAEIRNSKSIKSKTSRVENSQNFSEKKYCDNDPKISPASIIDGYDSSGNYSASSTFVNKNHWQRDREQSHFIDDPTLGCLDGSIKMKAAPRVRPCGTCAGCIRAEDCGNCDYCRDRRKFGGPNRMRQKCRLRQCTGSALSRTRLSLTPQSGGSRRRKQQSLQGVLLNSSTRVNHYNDFEDEPFEVPTDFSPRPYDEHVAHSLYGQQSAMQTGSLGSKMRRGDHRVPHRDYDALSSYQLGSASDATDFMDENSDDDLVLSGLPHCFGPACMSSPVPGGRYCSEACRVKYINSRTGFRSTFPRTEVHEAVVPYNLPYPDHMYCRHHRVYNWHSNGSLRCTPHRTVAQSYDQFPLEELDLIDALHRPQSHSFPYNSEPMYPASYRVSARNNSRADIRSSHTLNTLNSHGRPIICDTSDSAGIDSVESALRKGVVPLMEDMDVDLSHHRNPSAHLSPSTLSNIHPYYTAPTDVRSLVDLGHVEDSVDEMTSDVEALENEHTVPHLNEHYYCMITYNNNLNGQSSRTSINPSTALAERRVESSSLQARNLTQLLVPECGDGINGVGSSYSSVNSMDFSSTVHYTGITSTSGIATLSHPIMVGEVSSHSSVVPVASTTAYVPGPDEFYTITDSDDLEINWPQESVPTVNV